MSSSSAFTSVINTTYIPPVRFYNSHHSPPVSVLLPQCYTLHIPSYNLPSSPPSTPPFHSTCSSGTPRILSLLAALPLPGPDRSQIPGWGWIVINFIWTSLALSPCNPRACWQPPLLNTRGRRKTRPWWVPVWRFVKVGTGTSRPGSDRYSEEDNIGAPSCEKNSIELPPARWGFRCPPLQEDTSLAPRGGTPPSKLPKHSPCSCSTPSSSYHSPSQMKPSNSYHLPYLKLNQVPRLACLVRIYSLMPSHEFFLAPIKQIPASLIRSAHTIHTTHSSSTLPLEYIRIVSCYIVLLFAF